jgi:hypothetical protein
VDDQEFWKATNPACASGRMPIKNIARYRRKAGKIGFCPGDAVRLAQAGPGR